MYASAGAGLAGYKVKTAVGSGALTDYAGDKTISELIIPVGVGAKFKVSEKVNLDLGWTINYVDGDNLDGYYRGTNDKYNYAYAGLEFALGQGSQLAWHNPVALTYDEALQAKQTANALKGDLDAQKAENAKLRAEMGDLLKDSDGDGVADKLDKCPGTAAGTVVDGAGCELKTPAPVHARAGWLGRHDARAPDRGDVCERVEHGEPAAFVLHAARAGELEEREGPRGRPPAAEATRPSVHAAANGVFWRGSSVNGARPGPRSARGLASTRGRSVAGEIPSGTPPEKLRSVSATRPRLARFSIIVASSNACACGWNA